MKKTIGLLMALLLLAGVLSACGSKESSGDKKSGDGDKKTNDFPGRLGIFSR